MILDSALYVNGRAVFEPYVDYRLIDGYYSRTFTVPAAACSSSATTEESPSIPVITGPLPADALLGRAVFRLWPVVQSS